LAASIITNAVAPLNPDTITSQLMAALLIRPLAALEGGAVVTVELTPPS
jgi:hypothetical protein